MLYVHFKHQHKTNFSVFTMCGHENTQLFKSFEFGNGSRMSDKKLTILEFKYLLNKKMVLKQAVKKYYKKEELQNILTVFISLK